MLKKQNILYIGYDFSEGKIGGNIVRKNNYLMLKDIFHENMYEYFIKTNKKTKDILQNYLTLSFNGQKKENEKNIIDLIEKEKIEKIFFDGSIFGNLYLKIRKKFFNIEIITFFHNIEKNYFKERIRVEGITRYLLLPSIIYNEKLSIKNTNKIITLNRRDTLELKKEYEKHLDNKLIEEIPIFMKDRFEEKREVKRCNYRYLFIGSGFYANVQGITWFIENVLPCVEGKLLVIGKGMEILKKKFDNNMKLEILGTVKDIEEYYYEDNIIISPIFYGSGMKTKTVEALMYGKYIIGTKEAFVGIEDNEIEKIGILCESRLEFIQNIRKLRSIECKSREVYLNKFSYIEAKKKFEKIFINEMKL